MSLLLRTTKALRRIIRVLREQAKNIKILRDIKVRREQVLVKNTQANHLNALQVVRRKIENHGKVNVCFTVAIASMFPARPLFEKLIYDDLFNPFILIIPDLRFGKDKVAAGQLRCYAEMLKSYNEEYIKVVVSENDNFDIHKEVDIVVPSLPYDISIDRYNIKNFHKNNKLSVLVNYGFFRSIYDRKIYALCNYSSCWKVFLETEYNLVEYRNYSLSKGQNAVLSGYCKMDTYREIERTNGTIIMICPHHSVDGGYNDYLSLSNFIAYAELFLALPSKYPNITFIFRPHPALFLFLEKSSQWGKARVDEYILKMKACVNVIFSEGADYFQDFALSDGIIQDCGSYLVEYFYTKKPCCYLLKAKSDIEEKFTELGKQCLDNCYIAYEEKQIIEFIDTVIVNGIDPKKLARECFAEEKVMFNYPNATDAIVYELKKELTEARAEK